MFSILLYVIVICIGFLWYIGVFGEEKPAVYNPNQATTFIYLNKNSGRGRTSYQETILVENAPTDDKDTEYILFNYFDKQNRICLCDTSIVYYGMTFYRNSSCTRYFINKAEDPGGFSSYSISEDCEKDGLYDISFKREENSDFNVWSYQDWGRKRKYSNKKITCDYVKQAPIDLPERPYNE